ncbi:MAG: oxaloacetate decarboxylase [Actinobacteria bacterium]|jgi:2-methylisocitrate lyase-like PEP mutase family enzyme|nr:oxaloacetate decarboxylase [Actinomycetota bacterium]
MTEAPIPVTADPDFRRATLRALLATGDPLVLPGASDPAGAMLIERAGFAAAYATGAGISNAQFGLPDIGLVSQTEMLQQVARMVEATNLPLIVDADTGYGAVPSVIRTVQLLERAGASALQLEDQVMPKRCGHFDGHRLVDSAEMQAKIAAAVAARRDPHLLLIARTDARGVYGLDDALRRGHAYLKAGADALFIEAPRSIDEMAIIGREFAGVPLVANIVEGGKTPASSVADLHGLGFTIMLFANFLMRAMLFAGQQALAHLAAEGETDTYADRLLSWEDRQEMFRLGDFGAVEDRFLAAWGAQSLD